MNREEQRLQTQVIQWWGLEWRTLGAKHPSQLFHVPNGGKRSRIEGAIFKGMGVRPGLPDLWLVIPKNGWCGLTMELKSRGGRPTPEQIELDPILRDHSHLMTKWADELDKAIWVIRSYMRGELEHRFWHA